MTNLRWFVSPIIILLFLSNTPAAYSADILSQLHPYISVRGEYSDNLNLTAEDQKKDFYTTVTPGIKFSNMDAKSGVNLDASAGYVFYSKYDDLNYFTGNLNLDAKYLTSSHFNFYLRNSLIRSDNPRERELFTTSADNKFMLATESQRNVYWRNVVSPTVEYQFGPESRVGVTYRNNYYRSEDIDNNDSIENNATAFLTVWFNKQHGISLDYGYTNGHFQSQRPDLNGHRAGGAYMLRFTPRATASLKGAYTKQMFTQDLMNYQIYESSLGISYLFSPTLTASAEAGYYWMEPRLGSKQDGVLFRADITQLDARTTYRLSVQGGYTQDFFTSQNLGFRKYYRATGSITHFLERRLSIGCLGSIEYAETENEPPEENERDTIWGVGANISYTPFRWLVVSLAYDYRQSNANDPFTFSEYKENRGMLIITATY